MRTGLTVKLGCLIQVIIMAVRLAPIARSLGKAMGYGGLN